MNSEEIAARYIGSGAYFGGIPTRDLTREEWDSLDAATRQGCLDQKLYELADYRLGEMADEPTETAVKTIEEQHG